MTWESKPFFIKSLRSEEDRVFESVLTKRKPKKVVDLGCGVDYYLKKFVPRDTEYIGYDIIFGDDVLKIYKDKINGAFAISLGLMCLLTPSEKNIVLDKISEGLLQFNRIDTLEGQTLQFFDYLQFGIREYFVDEKELKALLSNFQILNLFYTKASFVVEIKNDLVTTP